MFTKRTNRFIIVAAFALILLVLLSLQSGDPRSYFPHGNRPEEKEKVLPDVKYIPQPTWTPSPVKDPFPSLETAASAPPIPSWNQPRKDAHTSYGISYAPPLFIGFSRMWPLLLQCVVSYITAGWPPEQIYVVENTGVLDANAKGKLTMQNPYYLNHKLLKKLGVNVVQAPVLMNFAQLQNFFTHLAQVHEWPYYFWSHMDVLVLSYEDGMEGVTPKANEPGYKSIYELCLETMATMMRSDERWADKFFSYDHLTLVNRAAYEEVGGWDSFIPYYMNDCDMHSRLLMHNWTQTDAKAGIITDTSTVLDDLRALYRQLDIEPAFTDPNPPPPNPDDKKRKRDDEAAPEQRGLEPTQLEYYEKLKAVADHMFHYKHGNRGRNTWQTGQSGGQGEPFYYPARGIAEAIDVLTEAGREIYRRKWGHRDCDVPTGTKLKVEDQWLVEKDWE